MDFVSSTLKFIGTLAQAGFDIVNNWQEFLETIDNITESLSNIKPSEIWEGIKALYEQVKTYFKEGDEFNWVRIAYIMGHAIAFIGTMFIPIAGWVGKIAKVDKLILDELPALLKTQVASFAKQLNSKKDEFGINHWTGRYDYRDPEAVGDEWIGLYPEYIISIDDEKGEAFAYHYYTGHIRIKLNEQGKYEV